MTRLRGGQTGVPIPTRVSDFSFPISSVPTLVPTQPHIQWALWLFPRVQAAGV